MNCEASQEGNVFVASRAAELCMNSSSNWWETDFTVSSIYTVQ